MNPQGYGQSTSTLIFAKNLVLPAVHFVLGIHFSLTIPFFFSLFKMANSHDRKSCKKTRRTQTTFLTTTASKRLQMLNKRTTNQLGY
ncbi:hypothetical protein OUZ56_001914 [Daphnia magna]|uniref:Transmembrane protein n=1 Tax=Daphnia magna TaxID=35525 RepID=A0ABR0A4L6_9CRUS|nr:hypothetical protein OUZ56_001914 [Daphnia magna]